MNSATADPTDWAVLDNLLCQAIELEEAERTAWLDALAAEQPAVAVRLQQLLALADGGSVLDLLMSAPVLEGALAQLTETGAGTRFGSWVIQRHLGMGGMAEVYLARRALEEGEQFAALKLISAGPARPDLLNKFVREAAILSQLNDPRIARLIDTGRAADGRPWLAMEYVDGDPVDRGCDRLGLGLRERVALLIEVALAVDHAHRHLVVHRDIKPANVMLCADGRSIRLLDFGIAKVLAHTGPEPAGATRAFTLNFASPEQLSDAPVSTTSDVYQLGVLMYLLLTGVRPFRDVPQNPAAILQAMQEGATPPSTTVLALRQRHPQRCGLRAEKLAAVLAGDLDTIALKAMASEPQRRYLSAHELAADLSRWCNGEAILARPDVWYRLGRRMRKHWIAVAAAAACLLLIVAYALTVTWQSAALQAERDAARWALARAEATRRFLVGVIGTANPVQGDGTRDIREALIQATDAVEQEFRGQPDVAAETYAELGLVFQGMEDAANAERAFRRSLALAPISAGNASNARSVGALAMALVELGRAAEGRELIARNRDHIRQRFGEHSDEYVHLLTAEARVEQALVGSGEDKAAREAVVMGVLQQALALHNGLHPPGTAYDASIEGMRSDLEGSIGATYLRAGKAAQAVPFLRRHHAQQLRMHGPNAARTLSSRMNLATTLQKLGEYAEAGQLLSGLVEGVRREYGERPNKMVAFALGALGNQARLTGAYDESARYWAQAEAEAVGALGAEHPWPATARYRQAEALALGGHKAQAIVLLEALRRIEGRSDDLAARAEALLATTRKP